MILANLGFLASGVGTRLDQCSDKTQQLDVLRSIAALTKKCANFNVGRFSAGADIGNVSDKNAP